MARSVTLNDNALITLSEVDRELSGYTEGDTDAEDDRIAALINEASDLFERVTNRKWYKQTGYTERVPGYGNETIQVGDHLPIDTVNSITYDDGAVTDTVSAGDYEVIEPDKGFIRRVHGLWRDTRRRETEITTEAVPGSAEPLYKVDYDGGYVTQQQVDDGTFSTVTLPWDVQRAALAYVTMRDSQQGSDPTVASISMDDGSIDYLTHNGQRLAVPTAFKHAVTNHTDRSAILA